MAFGLDLPLLELRRSILMLVHLCHLVYNSSILQLNCSVRLAGDVWIVSDQNNRDTTLVGILEQREDTVTRIGIKITRRLVREDELWLVYKRTSDCNTLLLAARKLTRKVFRIFQHADRIQRRQRPVLSLRCT